MSSETHTGINDNPTAEDLKQNSESWLKQEEEWIAKFFTTLVPKALPNTENSEIPTKDSCDTLASKILQSDDIQPVDNQGSVSYTVMSLQRQKIVQFRLRRMNEATLSLAHQTYGDLVPQLTLFENFALPVYVSSKATGHIHILQNFPSTRFPIERQIKTVEDVGRFITKAVLLPQPRTSYFPESWTLTAESTLRKLSNNEALRNIEPRFAERARSLLLGVGLLSKLPPVLTHPDFVEINMLVEPISGALTAVIDFEDAQVEAFGMNIYGVYESFFGAMMHGKWSWFDQTVSDFKDTRTVRQILESTFWDTFWNAISDSFTKAEYEDAIKMAVEVSIINRYFVRGLLEGYDDSKDEHVLGVEWARGVWLGR